MNKTTELKTPQDIEKRLDELTAFLTQSAKEVESNAEVDLMGIEYTIEHVCDAFSKLDDSNMAKLEHKLKSMIKALEKLADILKNHPDVVEGSETDFQDYEDDEDFDEDDDFDDDDEEEDVK